MLHCINTLYIDSIHTYYKFTIITFITHTYAIFLYMCIFATKLNHKLSVT